MRSKFLLGLLCISFVAFCFGCGGAQSGATLVKVGQEKITEGDLNLLLQVNPRLKSRANTAGGRRQILDNYVEQSLLYQEATKRGVDKDPLVQAKVDLYRKVIVAQGLLEQETKRAVEEYYKNHRDEFEKVKAAHIYIPFKTEAKNPALEKGDQVRRSPEEALVEAQKIKKELAKDPTQFDALAEKRSEHKQSKKRGGELGWVTISSERYQRFGWSKVLEQVFAMKEGEISEPIHSDNGYHLVKVVAAKKLDSLSDVESRIQFKLQGQMKKDLVESLKKEYSVVFAEEKKAGKEKAATEPPTKDSVGEGDAVPDLNP